MNNQLLQSTNNISNNIDEKCWFKLLQECMQVYGNIFPRHTHHNRLLRFILCKSIDPETVWYEHFYVHEAYIMLSRDLQAFNDQSNSFIDDEDLFNHFNQIVSQLFSASNTPIDWIGSTVQQLIDYSIFGYTINYNKLGFDSSDPSILEAFASYKNHYFQHYCCIDLDTYSLQRIQQDPQQHFGNFFKVHLDRSLCSMFDIIIIHPPYDIIVCGAVFQYIQKLYLQYSHLTFVLFIPYYKDWKDLQTFQTKCFQQQVLLRNTVAFIPNSVFVGNYSPIDLMYLCFGKIRFIPCKLPSN